MEKENKKLFRKRQRSENWSEEDKHLLMDLVRERVKAIENQNTDTNANAKKLAAWTDLLSSFNSMCKGGPRTLSQLKSQWGIIKMAKKKNMSLERKQILQTGGGPPPETDRQTTDPDDITSLLPNEFIVDTNEFDSDSINQAQLLKTSENIKIIAYEVENTQAVHVIEEIQDQKSQEVYKVTDNECFVKPPRTKQNKTPTKSFKRKNQNENKTNTYAANIAETEVQCRKELHQLQMENEKQKAKNLKH